MKVFVTTLFPLEPKRFGGGYQAIYPLVDAIGLENVVSLYHWSEPEAKTAIRIRYEKLCKKKLSGWFVAQISLAILIFKEKPDLLICSPDRSRVAFSVLIGRLLGVRVCLWQMDDIVNIPETVGILTKVKKVVRYIVGGLAYRSAHFRISASRPLADLYEKRYSQKVDRIIAKPLQETFLSSYRVSRPVRMVYAGSASFEFYLEPVIELARIIDDKFSGAIEISLYGPDVFPEELTRFKCVVEKGCMAEDDTVRPLTQYDYALLTYSFSQKTVDFFHSSFPSKMIGYVGAGLPVVSILDSRILVQKVLLARDVGIVVSAVEMIVDLPKLILDVKPVQWIEWSQNSHRWAVEEFQVNFDQLVKDIAGV